MRFSILFLSMIASSVLLSACKDCIKTNYSNAAGSASSSDTVDNVSIRKSSVGGSVEHLLFQANELEKTVDMSKSTKQNIDSLDKAAALLHSAIEEAPQNAIGYHRLGRVYRFKWEVLTLKMPSANSNAFDAISMNDDPNLELRLSALKMFRKAHHLDPQNKHFRLDLADHLLGVGEPKEALMLFRKALKQNVNGLYLFTRIGMAYLQMGQMKSARKHFETALNKAGSSQTHLRVKSNALKGLSMIAEKEKNFEESEKFLETAISLETHEETVACSYQALGDMYYSFDKQVKYAQAFKKSALLSGHNAKSQFKAAVASFLISDFSDSRKFINRISSEDPALMIAARTLDGYLFLLERKYDEAEQIFITIHKSQKEHQGARVGLGHLAVIKKKHDIARMYLKPIADSLLDKHTGKHTKYEVLVFQMAALGMGWTLSNKNLHRAAIKYFDKVLTHNSSDMFALMGKGNSLNALGELDAAEKILRFALEEYPNNQFAFAELGLVMFNRGKYKEAERNFKKAMERGKNKYTCPYEGLGMVYLKQGKTPLAKKNFEKAININPNIEFKKYNELAKIYLQQGKINKAKKLLIKSVENYKYDPEARLLLEGIAKREGQ